MDGLTEKKVVTKPGSGSVTAALGSIVSLDITYTRAHISYQESLLNAAHRSRFPGLQQASWTILHPTLLGNIIQAVQMTAV